MSDPFPQPRAPSGHGVVELRQYTLHPGQRDVLADLFDREFVESQEALGMRVLGQFRDLDDADRFVWLRSFADMRARAAALETFYGGPVWAAHRAAANATMIDSDDVLLLRPAWPGAGATLDAARRAPVGATALPHGVLEATVYSLAEAASADLVALVRDRLSAAWKAAGADLRGCYVTESAPNDFPRLPVREGEHVLVVLAMFASEVAQREFAARGASQRGSSELSRFLDAPPRTLRLAPTARSAMHA